MKRIEATIASSGIDEDPLAVAAGREPRGHVRIVVEEEMAQPIVEAIMAAERRGSGGNGPIGVSTINEVIHIRTGESGIEAL